MCSQRRIAMFGAGKGKKLRDGRCTAPGAAATANAAFHASGFVAKECLGSRFACL
jgi:hypothetical protein